MFWRRQPRRPRDESAAEAESGIPGRGPVVGVSAEVDELCVTDSRVFLNPSDLAPAEVSGRPDQAAASPKLAYAFGVWAARHLPDTEEAELSAANQAGRTLARLGVRGDALTAWALELRAWSGPHRRARAWTRALMKGHNRCAG